MSSGTDGTGRQADSEQDMPLSNRAAPYQPDADDVMWLDGVVLGLARAISDAAAPVIIAGGEAVMKAPPDEQSIDVLQATKRRVLLSCRLGVAVLGDRVPLDRVDRNDLRGMAHMLLGATWAPQERTRFAETLLTGIGPWFEDVPGDT